MQKKFVFFSPIVLMVVIIAVSQMLPQSEFSYGLYPFNMKAAMMVWFAYLLAAGSKNAKKVEGRGGKGAGG